MRYLLPLFAFGLVISGCVSLSDLEPAHKMAVENQQNLSSNIKTVLDEFVKIARSHPDFDPATDEAKLTEVCRVLLEQVAISTAYVALIEGMLNDKLEADDFVKLLDRIPELVKTGKNVWEELKPLVEKEE